MTTKKSYTPEFKRQAVRLAEESDNKSAVARDLGIHLSMLRRWKDEAGAVAVGDARQQSMGHVF